MEEEHPGRPGLREMVDRGGRMEPSSSCPARPNVSHKFLRFPRAWAAKSARVHLRLTSRADNVLTSQRHNAVTPCR
jgi:hypothetical protein